MKTFIQSIIHFGFLRNLSGNLDIRNEYHFKQFKFVIRPYEWALYYDRKSSYCSLFKNTFLGCGSIYDVKSAMKIIIETLQQTDYDLSSSSL